MAVRILITGDYFNPAGRDFLHPELQDRFKEHDLRICNFEAPVPYPSATPEPKAGPVMAQGAAAAERLAAAGFQLCTLANNHMLDYGGAGLESTRSCLEQVGLGTFGAGDSPSRAYVPHVTRIGTQSVALFNASERQFGALTEDAGDDAGYAWLGHPLLVQRITEARAQHDLTVLIAHAGLEESPLPLPYWRRRYRRLCVSGVDLVVAHHPHVPQGIERFQDSIIVYSLGNLFFDGGGYDRRPVYGYAVSITAEPGHRPVLERITHQQHRGKCLPIADASFTEYLATLDALLGDHDFDALAEVQCTAHMQAYVHGWYAKALLGAAPNQSAAQRFYHALAAVVSPRVHADRRRLLLMHLLNNETLREVAATALAAAGRPSDPTTHARYLALCRCGQRFAPLTAPV